VTELLQLLQETVRKILVWLEGQFIINVDYLPLFLILVYQT
jgi:hypothetical protein